MNQQTTVGFTPTTDRRQAVLLGTELRGLARMSEALDPSLVLLLANEFFAFASDIVTGHNGEAVTSQHEMLLSAFTRGNAIQVSQQAVRAAERIQSEFPAMAERWRRMAAAIGDRTAFMVHANSTEPGRSRDPPAIAPQPFQCRAQISVKRRRAVV